MFRTLLILMTLMPVPLGWWSECRKCRERQRLREELQREVEQNEKLRRHKTYPYFQLDVF